LADKAAGDQAAVGAPRVLDATYRRARLSVQYGYRRKEGLMRHIVACVGLVLVALCPALATEETKLPRIEVVANYNGASVYVHFDGEAPKGVTCTMAYRAGEAKAFRPGHPLALTGKGRLAASIFGLKPDEALEVRITVDDGSGNPIVLPAATRTRSDKFPAGAGKTYYVSASGSDAGAGTRQEPFKTIQHAADLAEPGDTILLADGNFFESVTIKRGGRPDGYITLRPDPAETAPPMHVTEEGGKGGFVERFVARPKIIGWTTDNGVWRDIGKNLCVSEEKRPVGVVTMDLDHPADRAQPAGTRIYHHGSLDELKAAAPPLVPGWWQDVKAGKLYLRGADGRGPRALTVRLGVLPRGLQFDGAGYWIVEDLGFEVFGGGPYGRGIDIINSSNIIVRECRFDTMRTGVAVRKPRSTNCLIERCRFSDSGIWTWPWKAVKAHDTEGGGVDLQGGGGNVVRFCNFSGMFNGIAASTWGDLENESLNRDLDIHDNAFTEIGDDPLEPEGACMNVRFWNNRTFDTHQGISLAPITVGPTYVVRDSYVNFKGTAVKVSVNSRGPVYLYHILGWTNRPEGNAMDVSGPWDNMHFRNSILRGTRYAVEDFRPHPIGCSYDYCDLFSTGKQFIKWSNQRYAGLEDAPAATFGTHNLRVEPYQKIEDGRPADLAPQLIDAGVVIPGINDDFKGKAPDIGPEEVR
jgi:hypothetical protein